ncbi:MAG: NFACT family protein [Desulfuromonas sp.]|nr:NFACT family protein [Desulfuromonas sp.]
MMDYFYLQALVRQLQPQLQGALLNKVFQPQEQLIILRLWNGGRQRRLLIDLNVETLGMYISTAPYRNPTRPPRFSQLLRARLHRLLTIEMDPCDRLVKLSFVGKNGEKYLLLLKLLGRSRNLLLLDEHNCIVDCMLRTKNNSQSDLVVGRQYVAPISTAEIPLHDVETYLQDASHKTEITAQWLMSHVYPMSNAVAVAIQNCSAHDAVKSCDALKNFVSSWQQGRLQPSVQRHVLTMQTSAIPLEIDLSDFAAQHYAASATDLGNNDVLAKAVKKGLKKLRQRLVKIEQQIDSCLLADDQRQLGELLLANLHLIHRGMQEISVLDYYQDPPLPIVIPLDSAKLPQANAEIYFKRYRKGKRGLDHCERRQQQTNDEIYWLQQIEQQLNDEAAAADLDIIRQELIDTGYYKPLTAIQRDTRHASAASLAKRERSPNGWEVIWGNNNKTNDYISKNLLKPMDLWFHAHNIPGCHVILKSAGAEVADVDLNYAATLAAQHSRAAKDDKVEVMVTEGKWVQRIKGAPLGLVKVKQYRIILVKLA